MSYKCEPNCNHGNCAFGEMMYQEYLIEQDTIRYLADQKRCESMPAHDECDFCRRPKHTGEDDCMCPECLEIPF